MRRFVLTLIFVASALGLSAQMRTSYFMEGSYFRTELNPALAPTRGYVMMPLLGGVGLSVNNNFFSVQNFIYSRDGHTVTALDGRVSADEFLSRLPKKGHLSFDGNINLLGVGFYDKHRMFWNFGVNQHITADFTVGKEIFEILKSIGNGCYDVHSLAFDATAYTELYLGWSMDVADFVTVGAKVKGLFGIANVGGSVSQMTANIGSDAISAAMRGAMRSSGILSSGVAAGQQIAFSHLISDNLNFSALNSGGVAVDLGAEVRLLDDRLKLSAAVTDLGFIRWSDKGATAGDVALDFYTRGFNLKDGQEDFESSGSFISTQAVSYIRRLNTTLNVGAEYNILDNHIGFGLLSHTQFRPLYISTELTASVNFRPAEWFTTTLSHTLCNHNGAGIFGFAFNIHPKGFNLFMGMDYIDTSFVKWSTAVVPKRMKSVNAYIGLGFNL